MTYRKANLTDSKELYELICDLEEKMLSYEKFYDILNEQLQDRQHYYFLLCEDDSGILYSSGQKAAGAGKRSV